MAGGYPMFAETKSLNEECGVFGIWGDPEANQLTYFGLHSLQHRGQEGVGIVTTDGERLQGIKGEGLLNEVFDEKKLDSLKGIGAIGHVRYGGKRGLKIFSPFFSTHLAEALRLHKMET